MKLISIVPVNNPEDVFKGSYTMLLTHLVEKDLYPECNNPDCYKILDNSLIELGGAVSIYRVLDAAKKCNADEIILPDVFLSGEGTIAAVTHALNAIAIEEATYGPLPYKLMAVCHGKDAEEFEWCFHELEQLPIDVIGIPKVAETLHAKGRPGFEYLWQGSSKEIHLLGTWTNLRELTEYKHPETIRSVDTCIPSLNSIHGFGAFEDRPKQTIDLEHDKYDPEQYAKIMEDLAANGITI